MGRRCNFFWGASACEGPRCGLLLAWADVEKERIHLPWCLIEGYVRVHTESSWWNVRLTNHEDKARVLRLASGSVRCQRRQLFGCLTIHANHNSPVSFIQVRDDRSFTLEIAKLHALVHNACLSTHGFNG